MQLVGDLAHAATTTISTNLPAMMGMMLGGPMGAMAGPRAGNDSKQQTKGKKSKDADRPNTVSQPNVTIADANDPAYKVAGEVAVPITLLTTLLGAFNNTGVDWENLTPKASVGEKPKDGLTFIEITIKHTLGSTQWGEGEASQQLKAVLTKLSEVYH